MSTMDKVDVSREVLDWAASQVGSSLDELAYKVSKRQAEDIARGALTGSQAIKFAQLTGVPLGYLFLKAPPADRTLPVADFRTLPAAYPLGRDFFEVFDDLQYKQAWFREYLLHVNAEPLSFVGKFKGKNPSPGTVAADMRQVLAIEPNTTKVLRSVPDHFKLLSSKCEDARILVFKSGIVGANSNRRLSVDEFRGFVLSDRYAPVVFINGRDAPAAWVFTLAHELAHIWMGDSGVSDVAPKAENDRERFCNQVAAEFLVPEDEFIGAWEESPEQETVDRIQFARKRFRVSALVIARRALEVDLISKKAFFDFYSNEREKAKGKDSDGGDFYNTLPTRNSKRFAKRVASMAVSGEITLREAGRLLNTNPDNVVKFYKKKHAISF